MRLWSIHPKYLDSKGLVALWREGLLAKHVLGGRTEAYKNHPQLNRFKECDNPLACINQYLKYIYKESKQRGYNFDRNKIDPVFYPIRLTVTDQQMHYELQHLLKKLKTRSSPGFSFLNSQKNLDPHPLFHIIKGEIEDWEKLS